MLKEPRNYKGIHSNLHHLIQRAINEMVNESQQRVADSEHLNVSDIAIICDLSKDNHIRWTYIRMLKEGKTIEEIKEYDRVRAMKEFVSMLTMLKGMTSFGSYGGGFY